MKNLDTTPDKKFSLFGFDIFLRISQKLDVIGQNWLWIWIPRSKNYMISIFAHSDQRKLIFFVTFFFKLSRKPDVMEQNGLWIRFEKWTKGFFLNFILYIFAWIFKILIYTLGQNQHTPLYFCSETSLFYFSFFFFLI